MDLFRRFVTACESAPGNTNLELYLSIWFQGIPWALIKRGNMEELMAYGFWYRTPAEMEAAGLGHVPGLMVDELERVWNHAFPPGYTEGTTFMSHIWDDLKVHYRPLLFYVAVEVLAACTRVAMRVMGFRYHRLGGTVYYTRGMQGRRRRRSSSGEAAAVAASASGLDESGVGARRVAERVDTAAAPILFLHGVGGLLIYVDLIRAICRLGGPVIAIDVRHVGMRLSPRIPCVDEMTSDILAILDAERVGKACVVGHSYGTLVASRLVKRFPSHLHSLCLIDPVCFGMYMPHLLHNFFYRRLTFDLKRPLQLFLDLIVFFASRDLHLSAAFSRRFYWSDVIMWPEELPPGSAVVLGAADDLVHADEVHAMLEGTCGSSVRSFYVPGMFHGAFLVLPDVKRMVVATIGRMARSAACDSHALAEAAAHDEGAEEAAVAEHEPRAGKVVAPEVDGEAAAWSEGLEAGGAEAGCGEASQIKASSFPACSSAVDGLIPARSCSHVVSSGGREQANAESSHRGSSSGLGALLGVQERAWVCTGVHPQPGAVAPQEPEGLPCDGVALGPCDSSVSSDLERSSSDDHATAGEVVLPQQQAKAARKLSAQRVTGSSPFGLLIWPPAAGAGVKQRRHTYSSPGDCISEAMLDAARRCSSYQPVH